MSSELNQLVGKNKVEETNKVSNQQIAKMIDHTLLKPESTECQIEQLCEEAREYGFATVCVNPYWVSKAAELLKGSEVGVTTVIGFPLGANSAFTKLTETKSALAAGATEIDMVINIGALKSGRFDEVRNEIESIVAVVGNKAIVKVIIETGLLNDEEKKKACLLSKMAGADFVKTSTGFVPGGATVEDIKLMRETVGPEMGIKASGGIRNAKVAHQLISAGATRLGASSGKEIISGKEGEGY